ncbi:unnamed protein product [Staurois parvus]|uniref:Uncharacterized protein n=1 Tax=Staurois parvus TaxID=386267 RepID=A0ABN9GXC5_9NEOB|nr:unnamed protein product [Staurois parvus]
MLHGTVKNCSTWASSSVAGTPYILERSHLKSSVTWTQKEEDGSCSRGGMMAQ